MEPIDRIGPRAPDGRRRVEEIEALLRPARREQESDARERKRRRQSPPPAVPVVREDEEGRPRVDVRA